MQHLQNNALQNSDWDVLSKNSLLPSASHARRWLAPMFEHFHEKSAQLISTGTSPLQAIAVLTKMTLPPGFPVPIAQSWDNGFLFSGIPLIGRDDPQTAISDLLINARQELGVKAVLFKKVQCHSSFDLALTQLRQNNIADHHLFNVHERAALDCNQDYDSWFGENFSRKRRKEYRRMRNRLAEMGTLQSRVLQQGDPVEQWVEEFLKLEKSGWKGRKGTAIACSKEKTAHLRHALPEMAQNGSLLFWTITLNDKPVASLFGFLEHNQVWLGKMAFDETLAQYSPGVLVILDASKDLFARENITMADSSADPDHPMINNIWRDRIRIADYLIATPGTNQATFNSLVVFEQARRKARHIAKTAYYRLRKGLKK